MHRTLVSTDELLTHLADPAWAVVDCRFDLADEALGAAQHGRGHVPGAIYANLAHDLSAAKTAGGGRHPLPSHDAMAATFSAWGIGPDVQVVCYDQDSGAFAARLWWMLRYVGHDAVAVLDGGFAKWMREGKAQHASGEARTAAAFVAAPRESMRRSVGEVVALTAEPAARLVDARAPARFEGRSEPIDRVAGHIPGAHNHHFRENLAPDQTMLPAEQLRPQLLASLGGTPPQRTTMYCGSGVTACQNLLAMEHAGLPGASLFVGSWSEWSADPSRAIEQGPEREAT
jgi:thiosulfate/3-mercaptopyruvate sulfurtransferase